MRRYTRALARSYASRELAQRSVAAVDHTQRLLRRSALIRSLALVGLLVCAAAITCVAR